MLQAALPKAVKDELLAARTLTTVSALFVTLKLYAPGGLAERNELLDSLTSLGVAKSAQDAVAQIRKWHRCLARAQSMGVAIPDAARLIKALDSLSEGLLHKHAQVAFRLSQARTYLQLDHVPSMTALQEFARIMQSEWEMVAVSGADDGSKPKLNKVEAEEGKSGGKERKAGKGKGEKEGGPEHQKKEEKGGKGEGKIQAKGEGKLCGFYLTPSGCSKGRQCSFVHQFGKAKGESRCYNCGSTEHRQGDCTRPTGGGKPQAQSKGRGGNSSAPAAGHGTQSTSTGTQSSSQPSGNGGSGSSHAPAKTAGDNGATAPGGVHGNQGNQGSSSAQGATVTQAQVLEEAQKLLKSLRIASMRVSSSRESSPERVGDVHTTEDGESNPEEERPRVSAVDITSESGVFVPSVALRRSRMPTGLLDGGATHALRQAIPDEWERGTPTRVALAVGSQDLRISDLGTVLSQDPIAPIVPLGLLVSLLGCRVTWNSGQCIVDHPTRGNLGVWLEDNCPVVSERDCLELISEVEQHRAARLRQALHIRALGLGVDLTLGSDQGHDSSSEVEQELARWVKARFPEAPDWLLLKSLPVQGGGAAQSPYHLPGLNRKARKALKRAKHIVLHVFSGRTKPVEFGLGKDIAVVNLDALYGGDILDERVYAATAALCGTGKVDAVIGGPPCCTNSVLRDRGAGNQQSAPDGGPRPVRERSGMLRFGLPSNTVEEQKKVDEHSLLIFRFLTIHHLADVANPHGTMCAMENPEDPMSYLPEHKRHDELPSVWVWPEILEILERLEDIPHAAGPGTAPDYDGGTPDNLEPPSSSSDPQQHRISWYLPRFDQGILGHAIRKPSAVLTNSWYLYQELDGLRGTTHHEGHVVTPQDLGERIRLSGYWAKWAPGLCTAIGKAICKWITSSRSQREEEEEVEGRVMLRELTKRELEFRKHCAQGHVVFRRDCRACLQGQMRSHVHRRQKHRGSNTFCLSMDLVGPWKPGKDHLLGTPATRFLIAALSVPLPGHLNVDEEPGVINLEPDRDVVAQAAGESEGREERVESEPADYEVGVEEDLAGEHDPSPEELDRRRRQGEEAWRKEAEKLQEPVPTHDLIFVEPITSKKASEVLRAIQRVWVKILGLGLTVRRLHIDGGRELCNKHLDAWALARDLQHTYNVPSDPKSNGRIENGVKHAKAGVRTLLCSDETTSTEHWPSALRQWAEQRLRKSFQLLHVPDPIRPLPPFGTQVILENRQWTRKTPHDSKAMQGKVLCPAANSPNTSVLLLENGQFYVAPVVYQDVLEPPSFQGHVAEDVPPAPPRRITRKTSMATKNGRGESEGLDPVGDVSLGDVGSGGVSVLGDADSGGDAVLEGLGDELDEFEGMVPDFGAHEGASESGVGVRNLWHEELVCKLCDAPRSANCLDVCQSCGTWQGRILSRDESEAKASQLLQGRGTISRSEVNALLRSSMMGWNARTRPCDKEAGEKGTLGWTLGQYVYGSQVGLTKETYRRPQLTKLLNCYMRQTLDSSVCWTAIRVTCNCEAGPHVDCNEPGSLNVVVPISWFDEGRIWVEGEPSDDNAAVACKLVRGEQRKGYLIGGSKEVACFDPRHVHAVEPANGQRRVLVGYTPRLLNRLPDTLKKQLTELGFRTPTTMENPRCEEQDERVMVVDREGDPQESKQDEDKEAGVSPGGDGSKMDWETEAYQEGKQNEFLDTLHDQYMLLRRVEMDTRKHFDEELELAAEQGWTACTDHLLELKERVQDLEGWGIKMDAASRLNSLVGDSETKVLRARLRRMGVDPEEVEGVPFENNEWFPLSGSPMDTERDSGYNPEHSATPCIPPGPKAHEAIPAAPIP